MELLFRLTNQPGISVNLRFGKLLMLMLVCGGVVLAPALMAAEEDPQRLTRSDKPDGGDYSGFGRYADTEGDLMVVSATGRANTNTGEEDDIRAAYVFERQGGEWQEVAKVTQPELDDDALFGTPAQLDGDLMIVAAPGETVNGIPGAGAIYVFERGADASSWSQIARLVASDPVTDAELGRDLAIDDGRVAAIAGGADGTAYLFERDADGWHEVARFAGVASDGPDRSQVEVSGDTLVHSTSGDNEVRVYEHDGFGWPLRAAFERKHISEVALEDDVLGITFQHDSIPDSERGNEGIVRVYERDGANWSEVVVLQAPRPEPTHRFGDTLDLRDGVLAIGQRPEDGQVHVFARDDDGEWTHFLSRTATISWDHSYHIAVSAETLAFGIVQAAAVFVHDIAGRVPSAGNVEDGDDAAGDDTGGDDTGGGDTGGGDTGGGDTGGGDAGNGDEDAGEDDSEGIGGGTGDDNEGAGDGTDEGESGDDDTGGNGDDTGVNFDEDPSQSSGSGGGAVSLLLPLLFGLRFVLVYVRKRPSLFFPG